MSKQHKPSSIETINEHIKRLDKIVEENNINAGYQHFCKYADSLVDNAKEAKLEFPCSENELATGNIYVNLSKSVIQMQSIVLTTYVNFMYLKRYMKEKNIQAIDVSDNITVSLDTFELSEMIQDCIKMVETLNPDALELDVVERKLVESTTDNKNDG